MSRVWDAPEADASRELRALLPPPVLALVGEEQSARGALRAGAREAWHSARGGRVERYVETDLTPEPGFSGGLGFDAGGRALGMSSAGLLRGVALLLERATLERIVGGLVSHGRVRRGYLGVGTQAVRLPDDLRALAGQASGLLVSSVQPGSAAEKARLMLGDVLLVLGGAQLLERAGAAGRLGRR